MSDSGFSLFQPKGSGDADRSVLTPPSAPAQAEQTPAAPVVPPSAPPLFPPANAAPGGAPPAARPQGGAPLGLPAPSPQAALAAPPSTPPVASSLAGLLAPAVSVPATAAPTSTAPAPAAPTGQPAPTASAPVAHAAPTASAVAPPAPAPAMAPPATPAAGQAPAAPHEVQTSTAQHSPAPASAPEHRGGRRTADTPADGDLLWALHQVVREGASDLHLAVDAAPRIRLHGSLRDLATAVPWTTDKMRSALHSIMSPAQRETFDEVLELDFAFTLTEDSRFRVNVYQQRGKMGAAFRLIPTEIKSLHELGVPDVVSRFSTLPRGLVLVTGPTGSGKSTTLAALIDLVNRTRADHIVTVEDPIEFMHQNRKSLVNQREVGADTHSFQAALKHVLRQDPDVILIGELRDLETISTALTAAETGHLVFATLHTQSAGQTVDRVIDVFPPHQQGQVRAQLAATLQGVVCQTLVPRASGAGRAVATEILVATPAIANLIREGKTFQIPSALQSGGEIGMHTMDQHLADLVNHGVITHAAAVEKAQDLESLKQLIHRGDSMAGAGGLGQGGGY